MRTLVIFFSVIAAIAGLGVGWYVYHYEEPLKIATVLSPAKKLPDFSMVYGNGTPMNPRTMTGQSYLLFFGFTHCPDVCPTELANIAAAYDVLREEGVAHLPQVVFVSVDPQRDTPEQLSSYVQFFDSSFKGAVGDLANTAILAKDLGVLYEWVATVGGKTVRLNTKQPIPELFKDNYVVNHAATIYYINDQAQLQAFFLQATHNPKVLASELRRLIS